MGIDRISTYGSHQRTLTSFNTVQQRLATLQSQISGGVKTDNFAGLNGQIEQYSSLDTKLTKAKAYVQNNKLVLSRVQATSNSLEDAIGIATDIRNLLVQRRSAGGDSIAFKQQMESLKQQFAGILNSSAEGRYLFAGTATDTQPVPTPNIPQPLQKGVPDAGYYQGSNGSVTARIDDGYDITYSINGDALAFQQVFSAIFEGTGAETAQGGLIDGEIGHAIDTISAAITGLTSLKASSDANIVIIEEVNQRHETFQTYWKGVSESILSTDILEASTQVAIDQGVLQASFQAFARLSSLKLSDFL